MENLFKISEQQWNKQKRKQKFKNKKRDKNRDEHDKDPRHYKHNYNED